MNTARIFDYNKNRFGYVCYSANAELWIHKKYPNANHRNRFVSVIPDEQLLNGMIAAGMNPGIAKGLVEMNAGRHNTLYEDYYRNKPTFGKVKLKDFAKEFAIAFSES